MTFLELYTQLVVIREFLNTNENAEDAMYHIMLNPINDIWELMSKEEQDRANTIAMALVWPRT